MAGDKIMVRSSRGETVEEGIGKHLLDRWTQVSIKEEKPIIFLLCQWEADRKSVV